MSDYPEDVDGDVLRSIARNGSDMDAPMKIDYQIACTDPNACQAIAEAARKVGYSVSIYGDLEEDGALTVECSREMRATYEGVIACQNELDDLAKPLGGSIDGWGTFGNKPDIDS